MIAYLFKNMTTQSFLWKAIIFWDLLQQEITSNIKSIYVLILYIKDSVTFFNSIFTLFPPT